MRQQRFEDLHGEHWDRLEAWLEGQPTLGAEDIPSAYRQAAHHLALARERAYAPHLVARLERLVLALHTRLHTARAGEGGRGLWRFLARDLPVAFRAQGWQAAFASLIFFGPLVAAFVAGRLDPDLVYLVMSPEQAAELARMYDPAGGAFAQFQGPSRDVAMFGFYIFNNIGIDFQCFASGLVLGVGPLFYLPFNGLHIGAAMAHMANLGHIATFYGFISGHSAPELLGIVLAGTGGLRLGMGILRPGREPRLEALKRAGREATPLILGAALFTFVAAALEAFWSANRLVPWKGKVGVGLMVWALCFAYLLFAGRRRA